MTNPDNSLSRIKDFLALNPSILPDDRFIITGDTLLEIRRLYQAVIEHSRVDVEALRGELADLNVTLSDQETELDKLRAQNRALVEGIRFAAIICRAKTSIEWLNFGIGLEQLIQRGEEALANAGGH